MAQDEPPPPPEPDTIKVYPGDAVQITLNGHALCGFFGLVEQTYGWGIGVQVTAVVHGEPSLQYHRLRPGQFHVCGPAAIMPGEVAAARSMALATERAVAREGANG